MLTIAMLLHGFGPAKASAAVVEAMLREYLSFIVLLFTLYTVTGGIAIGGVLRGTPFVNTGVLGLGTLLASAIGTTGAALLLVRPLIQANAQRAYKTHIVIFFIILAGNVGGALTPLGDPPLLVGFLQGVDFFWPAKNMWMQTGIVAVLLLAMFFALDVWFMRKEVPSSEELRASRIEVHGGINFALIGLAIASIAASALWNPNVSFDVLGTKVELQNLARDASLLAIAALSLRLTPETRKANNFIWEPIREVAILFAGIFIAIIPVLAMLQAGRRGAFSWLLSAVTEPDGSPHEAAYFWLTGLFSAFLDNVPTYLAFFELAGGQANELMGPLGGTLASISMGAVYMGGLTYIGNAPNFMIYSIARERGIKMPNFFGYMLRAAIILLPLFALLTLLPISPILKWE